MTVPPTQSSVLSPQSSVEFLAIGHVTRDVGPGGWQLGGAGAYAALTAAGLGLSTGLVTSADPGLPLAERLPGVAIAGRPATASTTFENRRQDRQRVQFVRAVAESLGAADVPAAWRRARLVLLAPVAREIEPGLAAIFPTSLIGVAPQGWFRQWDADGRVRPRRWLEADRILPHVDAVALSVEDVDRDEREIARIAAAVPILLITEGERGARLHWRGQWQRIPAFEAREVDPTGAGDVFAAAFLVRYAECGDPVVAARFASAAGSCCVEAPGLAGVPDRAAIERRLSV